MKADHAKGYDDYIYGRETMLMSKKVQKNYSMITTGFVEQEGEDYA